MGFNIVRSILPDKTDIKLRLPKGVFKLAICVTYSHAATTAVMSLRSTKTTQRKEI